ncbi:MAG: diguanylate cyclase domain-containing protein [Dehalococcoidia bacterium]
MEEHVTEVAGTETRAIEPVWDRLPGIFSWEAFVPFAGVITFQTKRRGGALSLLLVGLEESSSLMAPDGIDLEETVLRVVSAAVLPVSRGGDVIARYGPRSFAILAQDAQESGARRLAERLRQRLPDHLGMGAQSLALRYFIGFATLPQHGTLIQELVQQAEASLVHGPVENRAALSVSAPLPVPRIPEPSRPRGIQPGEQDRLSAERRVALEYLSRLYERGLIKGIAIGTQTSACPVCLDAAREVYRVSDLPQLPLIGCTGPIGCRCGYGSPAFDWRPVPLPRLAEGDAPVDIPRKLRSAALYGSDPKRGCKPEELAEYLDSFPLLPFRADLVLQPGEAVYLSRPARRAVELATPESVVTHGSPVPITQPFLSWLDQAEKPSSVPEEAIPAKDEGELFMTNRRLVFRNRQRRLVDSLLLSDIMTVEYLRDTIACEVSGQYSRLIFLLREPLHTGLYLARLIRYAALGR